MHLTERYFGRVSEVSAELAWIQIGGFLAMEFIFFALFMALF